jgi:peptide/nickel transport system substrate-binding protein
VSRSKACAAAALLIGVSAVAAAVGTLGSAASTRSGGIARIVLQSADLDSLDPALSYDEASGALVEPTCARLMAYPDKSLSSGLRLQPEVAAGFPRVSRDYRTYTFRLRPGFRFNDGTPVRADAFAHAIDRTLSPALQSPLEQYTQNIVGADRVIAGKSKSASGLVALGLTLVIHLVRPAPDFPAQTTMFCAVPPTLPADPEGVPDGPAAGPYYVAEYRPREKVVLKRNPYYGGARPHHVDGFEVDLRPTAYGEILDRIERNEADWGWAVAAAYAEPGRRLVAKYGIGRSRFFITPGFGFYGFVLNSSRPLFRDNPQLRQAVNFAVDRTAIREVTGGLFATEPTDQYLAPRMPGYRDAHVYPLEKPDLRRARALARGHLRSGVAVLYTVDRSDHIAAAQRLKVELAKIGLRVRIEPIPKSAYFPNGRRPALAQTGPYDIGFQPWAPDYLDPYSVLNVFFDGQFIGTTNWGRFDSPEYDGLLRHAASLEGEARYAAYGALDGKIARDAAPMIAVSFSKTPTLVSSRVGCIVLRPQLDLTAMCLR